MPTARIIAGTKRYTDINDLNQLKVPPNCSGLRSIVASRVWLGRMIFGIPDEPPLRLLI
jgi:hypothetical protein